MNELEKLKLDIIHKKLVNNGFKQYKVKDISIEVSQLTNDQSISEFMHKENCVYFPMMSQGITFTKVEELTLDHRLYFQIILRPEIADALYISKFYNSKSGTYLRHSLLRGTFNQKIFKKDLIESNVYVPDISKQKELEQTDLVLEIEE